MKRKSGITVAVLVVTIAVMSLILGTAVIFGLNSVNVANADKYKSILSRVEEASSLFFDQNGYYPVQKDGEKEIALSTETLNTNLKAELLEKNDVENYIYVLDIKALRLVAMDIGTAVGDATTILETKDAFLVNKNSGNVYYLKGFETAGKRIYSLK
ncbi:MAG: hypothetical protein RR594_05525 [Clostridia bacterium]